MIRPKQILTPDRPLMNMPNGSKKRVLKQIASLIARELPEFDAQATFENLVAREKFGFTGFGNGIAIPHYRLSGYQSPTSAALYLDVPVGFDALNGTPISLLLVLLAPEVMIEEHLKLFWQITAMPDRADVRDRLCGTPIAEALYQTVVDVQNRQ